MKGKYKFSTFSLFYTAEKKRGGFAANIGWNLGQAIVTHVSCSTLRKGAVMACVNL